MVWGLWIAPVWATTITITLPDATGERVVEECADLLGYQEGMAQTRHAYCEERVSAWAAKQVWNDRIKGVVRMWLGGGS